MKRKVLLKNAMRHPVQELKPKSYDLKLNTPDHLAMRFQRDKFIWLNPETLSTAVNTREMVCSCSAY